MKLIFLTIVLMLLASGSTVRGDLEQDVQPGLGLAKTLAGVGGSYSSKEDDDNFPGLGSKGLLNSIGDVAAKAAQGAGSTLANAPS